MRPLYIYILNGPSQVYRRLISVFVFHFLERKYTDVKKKNSSKSKREYLLSLVYMHNLHPGANLLWGAKLHPGVNLLPLM